MPAREAPQVVGSVLPTSADVWYMLAKNEARGFAEMENADLLSERAILFFERHHLGP